MAFHILAQVPESESLIDHHDFGLLGPNPVMYVIVFCAALILASGIYGLNTSRKNPDRLMPAMFLHAFVLMTVIALAFGASLLGYHSSMESVRYAGVPDPAMLVRDQAFIAMNGVRFAVVVAVGAIMGAVALLIKRSPESK